MSVNQFDIAFIIDTTGSMGAFLEAAKRSVVEIIKEAGKDSSVDIKVGIVEYRDHPPQEHTYVTKIYPFTSLAEAKKHINKLQLGGGGDEQEAVLDGVVHGCEQLAWRANARRIMILVGDASPHGYGFSSSDGFPKGCPCGKTIPNTALALEEALITLYAIGLQDSTRVPFELLCQLTGGSYYGSNQVASAIKEIQRIINTEFKNVEFDQDVLSLWNDGIRDKYEVADRLKTTTQEVLDSMGRLRSRNLVIAPAVEYEAIAVS